MATSEPIMIETTGESQTIALGVRLGAILRAGDVVALQGELGAGKTRMVRGIAEALGHDPRGVSSPTYVVMNEYAAPDARAPLVHIDAYRLTGSEELANAGWDQVLDGTSVVVIEWPERISDALPSSRFEVRLEHTGPDRRKLTITGPTGRDLSSVATFTAPTPCRICGKPVAPESAIFPFCSARCRTIDLGKWITGDYKVTRELKDVDLETND